LYFILLNFEKKIDYKLSTIKPGINYEQKHMTDLNKKFWYQNIRRK
jgi:hypothetical protein